MNVNDIDLDVSALISKVPDDHVVFYFRASGDDSKDFCQVSGNQEDMAQALANIMDQSDWIADMIGGAFGYYMDKE